jgi:hypothetical protein
MLFLIFSVALRVLRGESLLSCRLNKKSRALPCEDVRKLTARTLCCEWKVLRQVQEISHHGVYGEKLEVHTRRGTGFAHSH